MSQVESIGCYGRGLNPNRTKHYWASWFVMHGLQGSSGREHEGLIAGHVTMGEMMCAISP